MTRINENSPFPGGGRFWVGKTWGEVISYYAEYSARWPFCDGHAYREDGRLYLCHVGGRDEPTLRQMVPKCLEGFMLEAFADAGGQIEDGRRYNGQPKPDLVPLHGFNTELTPEGEQTVIPGCERDASDRTRQLDLF